MFGRTLKRRYRKRSYRLVDNETEEHVETRCMSLYDPLWIVYWCGFALVASVGIMYYCVVCPLTNTIMSDKNGFILFCVLFVIGANIGYWYISERE